MKNKINIKNIFLFFNFIGVVTYGQVIDTSYIANYDSTNIFYDLKKNLYEAGTSTFKANCFNMSSAMNLVLTRTSTDELSVIHRKYYQSYNNVPIIGSEFIVHENSAAGKYSANGKLLSTLSISSVPSISSREAIDRAIAEDGGSSYFWQDSLIEKELKDNTGNPDTSYYPAAQLVIGNSNYGSGSYLLAYKIRLYSKEPAQTYDYYIDAGTSKMITKYMISQSNCFSHQASQEKDNSTATEDVTAQPFGVASCNQPCNTGSANVKFYGSQYISTDKFTYAGVFCRYRPKNTCTSTYIYVQKPNGGGDYRQNGNSWGSSDQSATSALWCFERTHDYYRYNLNRNSFDNSSSQINIYPEDPNVPGNAFWNGSSIHIGTTGSPFSNELITLDVLGHEFTHGVTQYEAGLVYQGESGALNESFSDIFGIMVEFYGKQNYSTGWTPNYQIGEEVISGGLRDMSNPNAKNNPDTYNGAYWINPVTGPDNGGVHNNSGVQNYWFYLLSNGGSGVNDNSAQFCVTGIGRDKASKIAYRSLTTYLSSNSNFSNARYYSILSAIDLYGSGSNEVAQTTAAWYAVGVGPQFAGPVNIQNLTITSQYDAHYNAKISLQNVTVNTGPLYVSSNTQIELLPNININSGSVASFYIAPACAGGARMASTSDDNGTTAAQSNNLKLNEEELKAFDFSILPNPNNGEFKLVFNNDTELPTSIVIRDLLGKEIKTIQNPTEYEYNINLNALTNGIYIINSFYPDKTISKKIVKN